MDDSELNWSVAVLHNYALTIVQYQMQCLSKDKLIYHFTLTVEKMILDGNE